MRGINTAANVALPGLAGAGLLSILGSTMPWARVLAFSVSGTDGDGIITLIAGVAMIALAGVAFITKPISDWWWFAIWLGGVVLSVVVVGIAAYHIHNVSDLAGQRSTLGSVRVGGGLYVTAVGGVSGLLTSVPGFFAGHN